MEMREYLELCTGQMRCKAMRPVVEKELRAHIEDQMEAYLADGMEREAAEELAVKQMGDPAETGTALDRIHRPQMDWRAVLMILLAAAAGLLIQFIFSRENGNAAALRNYAGSTAAGILLMFGVCFADYTILGKYPRQIWCLMTALAVAATLFTEEINGMRQSGWTVMLLVPCFAGIVFYYREQRGLGIIKALLWLAASGIVLWRLGPEAMVTRGWLCGGIVMLGCAVAAGWYHVDKRLSALIFGLPVCAVLAGIGMILCRGSYQRERLLAFLDPGAYAEGAGYTYARVRGRLASVNLIGGTSLSLGDDGWQSRFWEEYALLEVGEKYGLLAAVLIVLILLALGAALTYRVVTQYNRLGVLTGIGCVYVLVFSLIVHALGSTGYFPINSALPFISMNGKQNVSLFVLMGVMLSIFRGKNIRPEPEIPERGRGWRIGSRIQKREPGV